MVSPYTEESGANATLVPAGNILWSYLTQYQPEGKENDKFYYLYDYGDSWLHEIEVLDLDRADQTKAELLEAEGACPPENCGGIPGFQMMKDYLSGQMTKQEYFDHFIAVDAEGFDFRKVDFGELARRVKNWRKMEER